MVAATGQKVQNTIVVRLKFKVAHVVAHASVVYPNYPLRKEFWN